MMASHTSRATTIGAAVAVLTAAAGLTACGSSSSAANSAAAPSSASTPAAVASTSAAPPSTTTTASPATSTAPISVTLTEYKIKAAASSARAGRVVFAVTNTGKIKHQFTVIRTTKPAATVLSKQNPNDDIAGARGEIASIAPGATKKLVIKHLAAGHYAFVCALPGHYQSGMHADFTVN